MIYVGIDNGVTGSVGIINDKTGENRLVQTPSKKEQSYTKHKQTISRLVFGDFYYILSDLKQQGLVRIALERPLVNAMRFKSTATALRCLEGQTIALEQLQLPYIFLDSKKWQKELLPKGVKGSRDLKKASLDIGIRLFPDLEDQIRKQKDADGILIAEWYRRTEK